MIDDAFVIDSTVHAFNFLPDNYLAEFLPDVMQQLYFGAHVGFHPKDDRKWDLTWEQFIHQFEYQPELVIESLFAESATDVFVYHGVPLEGLYRDGSSPMWVAYEAMKRHPNRVWGYIPVYPWAPDALDKIDEAAENDHILGVKFYPLDLFEGELKPSLMNTDATFAVLERCQERGIKMIGVHKAVPLGPMPFDPYFGVADTVSAIEAFPDLTFEIVHGGVAYLDETAHILANHANVTINLEGTVGFMHADPEEWDRILGTFLQVDDGAKRLFWSVGATGMHAQPLIETFWGWETSEKWPELTTEIKKDVLAGNYARYVGWDLDAMKASCAADQFGVDRPLAEPWHLIRDTWADRTTS